MDEELNENMTSSDEQESASPLEQTDAQLLEEETSSVMEENIDSELQTEAEIETTDEIAETIEEVDLEESASKDVDVEEIDATEMEKSVDVEIDEEEERLQRMRENRSNIIFYSILAVMVIGMAIFRGYWENNFGGVVVDGASMNQTLQNGDELLMKKVKSSSDYKRGDVIVVQVSDYEEFAGSGTKYIIKRLIAIEGDKVRCIDGQVEICYAGTTEYVTLEEEYAYYFRPMEEYDFEEYEVGIDEIFFLGDNRNNSVDSRYKEGGSRLDRLYKEDDIYGVVSEWAIENRAWLEKLLFWKN